tara:strand:- start:9898 stop:10200 length:303 start_codon:yes stop_codon:yes gene_type:complete
MGSTMGASGFGFVDRELAGLGACCFVAAVLGAFEPFLADVCEVPVVAREVAAVVRLAAVGLGLAAAGFFAAVGLGLAAAGFFAAGLRAAGAEGLAVGDLA